jgi:hypothetical protein
MLEGHWMFFEGTHKQMLDVSLLGSIIQAASIIATGLVAGMSMFYAMRGQIKALSHDVRVIEKGQANLNEAFKQLGAILTQVAVQDTRIALLEKIVDELRHGNGFVRMLKD